MQGMRHEWVTEKEKGNWKCKHVEKYDTWGNSWNNGEAKRKRKWWPKKEYSGKKLSFLLSLLHTWTVHIRSLTGSLSYGVTSANLWTIYYYLCFSLCPTHRKPGFWNHRFQAKKNLVNPPSLNSWLPIFSSFSSVVNSTRKGIGPIVSFIFPILVNVVSPPLNFLLNNFVVNVIHTFLGRYR